MSACTTTSGGEIIDIGQLVVVVMTRPLFGRWLLFVFIVVRD
jgi:hypothetical protein